MAVHTGPNEGLHYGYSSGENGWGDNLTADLKRVDALMHGVAKNRSTNTPPGTPSDGDRYVVGTSPTGAWVGHTNHIACYDGHGAAWVFYTPKKLWQIHVEAEGAQYVWNGTAWAMATCVEAAYFADLQDAVDAAAVNGAVVHVPKSMDPQLHAYWGASSPSFTGLVIPANVRVRCDPGVVLSDANYLGDPNRDMVQINGSYAGISGCSLLGPGQAGTGCGIHVNANGVNPIIGVFIEDVDIWGTASWNVKVTPVTVELQMTRVFCSSAFSGGSLFLEFNPATGSNSSTLLSRCLFNARGFGTYGAGIESGSVHIKGAMATVFHSCGFQHNFDTPALSLEGSCHQVELRGCTIFREAVACSTYIVTSSGSHFGILLDSVVLYDSVNTNGVRTYKSEASTGGCYDLTMRNVMVFSASDPGGDTEISFGSGTDDHLMMENVRCQAIGSGAERRLRLSSYGNVLRLGNMGAYMDETKRGAPLGLPTDSLVNIKAWTDVHEGDQGWDATNHRPVWYTGSKWQYATMNDS